MSEQDQKRAIDRYDLDPEGRCDGESGRCYAEMGVTPDGDYVLYSDFIIALAQARREGVGTLDPRLAALVEALTYVRDMIQQVPGGIEEEADEADTCPEDAAQHIGGLIYRCACRALADAKENI